MLWLTQLTSILWEPKTKVASGRAAAELFMTPRCKKLRALETKSTSNTTPIQPASRQQAVSGRAAPGVRVGPLASRLVISNNPSAQGQVFRNVGGLVCVKRRRGHRAATGFAFLVARGSVVH